MEEILDVTKKIERLTKRKGWISKGLDVARKFVKNKTDELEVLNSKIQQIDPLDDKTGPVSLEEIEDETLENIPIKNEDDDDEEGDFPGSTGNKLKGRRVWIKKGLKYVLVFIRKKSKELSDIEAELDALQTPNFLDPQKDKLKAVLPAEMLLMPEFAVAGKDANFQGTARRGAMTKKEKDELVEEASKKREEEKLRPGIQPVSRPQQPLRPGERPKQAEPDFQKLTPEQKKEYLVNKLKQKDPREQKKAIQLLKKPENKGLLPELMKDQEFAKLYKNAEKMVKKYDKIRDSIRKNLKTLMRSSSDVVKLQISRLRRGKVGSAISGLKEISNSVRFDNEVGKAAGAVVKGVKELYKMFDIKPEEALNKEMLEEARPVFTHQMAEKGKNDREIDLNSRQNKLWGESKEITDEEKKALAEISKKTGSDKLPPVEKKDDMKLVKDILIDTVKKEENAEFIRKQKREAEKAAILKQVNKNER